jgi:hypothetical protein
VQLFSANKPKEMAIKKYHFDGPKFFTFNRQKLPALKLPASAIAVYVLLHFICDGDTGEFARDDSELARMSKIPRQTIWTGFRYLVDAGLVYHVEGAFYMIADYAPLRAKQGSYFRIPKEFIAILAKCVRHHVADVILFGLQVLDQLRNEDAKAHYSKFSMKKYLGSFLCRIKRKLELLKDVITYVVQAGPNGETFIFKPVVKVLASEEQVKHRNTKGKIAKYLKDSLEATKRTYRVVHQESRRYINTCIRFIYDYCQENWIDENQMIQLSRLVGITLAQKRANGDPVQFPRAYLQAAIDDLVAQL